MKVAIFGHTTLDHIMSVVSHPRPDTSVPVINTVVAFGGTGANIARTLARLGVFTYLVSFVGEDFPTEFESVLRSDGVNLRFMTKVKGAATPKCWIFVDSKGRSLTYIEQGAMLHALKFDTYKSAIKAADIVHMGTGLPRYYLRVAKFAAAEGKLVAFDPSQEINYMYDRKIFSAIAEHAEIFFGNEHEAKTAMRYLGHHQMRDLNKTFKYAIVTLGKRGSIILHEGKKHKVQARAAKVVNPTGAGDAYRAGFYAAYVRGYDIIRCGVAGAIVASMAVSHAGAQGFVVSWEDVAALMSELST